ncbi:mechanosensitive ion channel domain-containing protein [Pseudoalteromonas luteoviolacea]|uniref:mechanosensitive ion channel domain-containing protein n=1 Tax=Pseudoalteromonas luteoviolacea TaxID=43657 RepID=UPI001FD009A5|nr:mechanosensitive ion channel domain-containing protein [Pseudoalteromonas luteoviolacea]
MNSTIVFEQLTSWIQQEAVAIFWTCFVFVCYGMLTRRLFPKIDQSVDDGGFKNDSLKKAYLTVRWLSGIVFSAVLLVVWGVDISGMLLMSTSILAVTGVALFANWSVLSNITAYFVLLFHSAYRRGNFVRVLDGDNYIEGYISDIGVFNTKFVTEDREIIIYPNNLLLGRPTQINPRNRFNSIGKIPKPEEKKMDELNKEI